MLSYSEISLVDRSHAKEKLFLLQSSPAKQESRVG